jgi:hypothetical protein
LCTSPGFLDRYFGVRHQLVQVRHNGLRRYDQRAICLDHREDLFSVLPEQCMPERLEGVAKLVEDAHYYA